MPLSLALCSPLPRAAESRHSLSYHLVVTSLLLACSLLTWPMLAQADEAASAPDAFFLRSSSCVAVMKSDLLDLTERYRRGETSVRPDIERLTELGFTFVGTAFKRGLRKAEADQLLDEAERKQSLQAPIVLQALSQDCQLEGQRLLKDANFLERALVRNRARARVDSLLAPDAP